MFTRCVYACIYIQYSWLHLRLNVVHIAYCVFRIVWLGSMTKTINFHGYRTSRDQRGGSTDLFCGTLWYHRYVLGANYFSPPNFFLLPPPLHSTYRWVGVFVQNISNVRVVICNCGVWELLLLWQHISRIHWHWTFSVTVMYNSSCLITSSLE